MKKCLTLQKMGEVRDELIDAFEQAEARALDAEARLGASQSAHDEDLDQSSARIVQAEAQIESAEARAERAESRAEALEARVQQLDLELVRTKCIFQKILRSFVRQCLHPPDMTRCTSPVLPAYFFKTVSICGALYVVTQCFSGRP